MGRVRVLVRIGAWAEADRGSQPFHNAGEMVERNVRNMLTPGAGRATLRHRIGGDDSVDARSGDRSRFFKKTGDSNG